MRKVFALFPPYCRIKLFWQFLLVLSLGFLPACHPLEAQGIGPRSNLLAPKGVTGINVKWLAMDSNIIPSGSALIPGADIAADIYPITLFHTFSLGGRFAQVYGMIAPGNATAAARIGPPVGPIPTNSVEASGLSDGFVSFKLGLIGAPSLNLAEFASAPFQFSLFGEFRIWYSGSYSSEDLFNLGTNRTTLEFGVPMAIPLNADKARATWLEIAPSIQFFTTNSNPARTSQASKVTQHPMFVVENHLSHNFTKKIWAVANLRFQFGGETSADGLDDSNAIRALGGGLGIGYQILAPLGISIDYGGVLASDQLKGQMLRCSLVFVYAKTPTRVPQD